VDLEICRPPDRYSIRGLRKPSKLVYNLIFSMPLGTSPKKLEKAVRMSEQEGEPGTRKHPQDDARTAKGFNSRSRCERIARDLSSRT
jgi:hypothetical protein